MRFKEASRVQLLVAGIGAVAVVAGAVVAKVDKIFPRPSPSPSTVPSTMGPFINLEGTLGRVESSDRCQSVGWVSLRMDDSVQLGLQSTRLSSEPQVALVRLRHRVGAGRIYDDLPSVSVNVGATGVIGEVDGITYSIKVSNIGECSVHYVAAASSW